MSVASKRHASILHRRIGEQSKPRREKARLRGAGASDERFQQGDVVIVAFALNVAMVESQLLRHRQAVHHSSVDQSLGEGVLGYRNGS